MQIRDYIEELKLQVKAEQAIVLAKAAILASLEGCEDLVLPGDIARVPRRSASTRLGTPRPKVPDAPKKRPYVRHKAVAGQDGPAIGRGVESDDDLMARITSVMRKKPCGMMVADIAEATGEQAKRISNFIYRRKGRVFKQIALGVYTLISPESRSGEVEPNPGG